MLVRLFERGVEKVMFISRDFFNTLEGMEAVLIGEKFWVCAKKPILGTLFIYPKITRVSIQTFATASGICPENRDS